jgi:hypothetical protein
MKIAGEEIRNQAETGSGLSNEGSLHSAIKEWYAAAGDRFEVRVGRSIVDIVRGDLLIEIQTKNFLAIKKKLLKLCKDYRVRLVYPIPEEKWILHIEKQGGEVLSKRRSPKKGKLTNLFDELIRIPEIINEDNISIEVLLVKIEEIRCADGRGSWRRKGVSIIDRKLIEVTDRIEFFNKFDFLKYLPEGLVEPFSNKNLADSLGSKVAIARKMTYCLKRMGVIEEVGKKGNELLFVLSSGCNCRCNRR